jgi:cytoskeletal protein RodZ
MTRRRKVIITSIILVVALAAAGVYYWQTHKTKRVETTSKSLTAQSDYHDGKPRSSNPSSGSSQGGAIDTHGSDAGSGPTSAGVSSESGAITVQQPDENGVVLSGAILSGTTKGITTIQYRVIDDQVGVVAQGTLSAESGTFSGKLQFTPRAITGRLDVYSFNAQGEEINNVQIPIRFKE